MSNAQAAETAFSTAQSTPNSAASPGASGDHLNLQKIIDRIEQMEFALAEAVLHFEAIGAIAHKQADTNSAEAQFARIADRLDAIERQANARFGPIEAALHALAQDLTQGAPTLADRTRNDRQAAQIAQLLDRFTHLEASISSKGGAEGPDAASVLQPIMARLDGLDASVDQRQQELAQNLQSLTAQDFSSLRESYARLMIAVQAVNQSHEATGRDVQEVLGKLSSDMTSVSEKLTSLNDQIAAVDATPLDQLEAFGTWMERQEVLQSAMSDLLGTLVDRDGSHDQKEIIEMVKTLIAAGQYSARKQIEGFETRFMAEVAELRRDFSQPGAVADAPVETAAVAEICEDDQRILAALQSLRTRIANAAVGDDEIEDETHQLRLSLAESLAAMQAEKKQRR